MHSAAMPGICRYTLVKPLVRPLKKQGTRVVLYMAEGLNNHNITDDSDEELLERKATMLGTVRKNQAGAFLWASGHHKQEGNIFIVCLRWLSHCHLLLPQDRQKHPTWWEPYTKMLSWAPEKTENQKCSGTTRQKEAMITWTRSQPHTAATPWLFCWPLVIFFNITDVSAYNAFVIWSELKES